MLMEWRSVRRLLLLLLLMLLVEVMQVGQGQVQWMVMSFEMFSGSGGAGCGRSGSRGGVKRRHEDGTLLVPAKRRLQAEGGRPAGRSRRLLSLL